MALKNESLGHNFSSSQNRWKWLAVCIFLLSPVLFISCNKDESNDDSIKQQVGEVWLSGGLAVCAEQIHLDNGDTLIVNLEDILSFRSGDRVHVKYKEVGLNKSCTPGIDCEIIEIKKVQ